MTQPSSPYRYFSDIYNAVIKDAKETTSSQIVSLVQRYINEGHELITLGKKRDWLDQQFTVQVNAAINAQCTVTRGSPIVTFVNGTTFPANVEFQFWNPGFQEVYNVAGTSSNVVTLNTPYLGTTNTAATGLVFQSSIILDPSIRQIYQIYHQFNSMPLTDIGPQQMRAVQEAQSPQTDYATYYTIFGQSNGARRALLYPYPLTSYTLYIDANTYVPVLSNPTDEPVIPMQYRQILYWYALYKLYTYHRNTQWATEAYTAYQLMLRRIDAETRAEIEFPQLSVVYPRGRSLKMFTPPFDPNWRN